MKLKAQNFPQILIFFLPLTALLIARLFGFDGLYGMDSYEYYRFTNELRTTILQGSTIGPFFWPHGYPLLVVIFSLFISTSLAGQLVCSISLSLLGVYAIKISDYLFPKAIYSRWLVLSALVCSPYFMRNGVQFMSDIPAVLSFMACLYFALKYSNEKNFRALLLCSFFAAFGIFIRLGVGVTLIPVFIYVSINWLQSKHWTHIFAITPVLLIYFLYQMLQSDVSEAFQHHFVDEWSISNYFETSFTSNEKHGLASFTYSFPNLVYFTFKLFHPGFFILNSLLVVITMFRKPTLPKPISIMLLSIVLINTLFLSGVTVQVERYLFLGYPVLIILLVPAFEIFILKLNRYKAFVIGFLLFLQIVLAIRAIYPSVSRNILEKQITAELSKYQGEVLYIFEMDLAMQQRKLDFDYKNLWFKEYDQFSHNALILFNESKFKERFESKTPMNNWNRLNQQYDLTKLSSFDKGWNLYRIE